MPRVIPWYIKTSLTSTLCMIVYAAGGNARNIFGVQNLQYGAGVQDVLEIKEGKKRTKRLKKY